MVDYQLLAIVAVGLAVVTRGKVLPVALMTAVVALAMLAYEVGVRRYRRRIDGPAEDSPATPSDTELTGWMSVIDRMLRSD